MSIWMRPEQPARGPRPGFSRAQLTEAAIRIADAEGLEALSMRRVATEIGSGTMSLYRYVSSKDDLIDLMMDAVAVEYIPADTELTGSWRADLRLLMIRSREVMHRHPWLAALAATRQAGGPQRIRLLDTTLGMMDGLGLGTHHMLTVVGSLAAYVNGFVAGELSEVEARRRTGLDLKEFMLQQAPYLQSLVQSGDYPMFSRMLTEGGSDFIDPDERFLYGLDRFLDGLANDLPG